jgi:feruloyl esterase
VLAASLALLLTIQQVPALAACSPAALQALTSPQLSIASADLVAAGAYTPPRGRGAMSDLPAFCRVQAVSIPRPESRIEFQVWIPRGWNGKIVVTGNGGYSNVPSYGDMAYAMRQGYAVAGGDTGHQGPAPDNLQWGAGRPDLIEDWASRSIHEITGPAKSIAAAVGGQSLRRAYYYGCSTGGHQGYAEIQRYPNDFDGVIAGAPGNNRVRLNAGFLWQFLSNHTRAGGADPILPASKLPAITRAVVAACDATDGVRDGVVDDPRACVFDPASLACNGEEDQPSCLTPPQLEALRKMYAGAVNPRTGAVVYPGWPKSSEALTSTPNGRPLSGWQQYWGSTEPTRAAFWRLWVFDNEQWDPWSFDFDRDLARADERLGRLVDQVEPDIQPFKASGGKAIVYQGWQDPVVNALDTIAYYERVRGRQGGQGATDDFFRLFMVPGMGHCGGGTGATSFGNQGSAPPVADASHDLLRALDAWVERGVPPDRLVAARVEGGAVVRERPLCPYPRRAVYKGSGSTEDAASFECRAP